MIALALIINANAQLLWKVSGNGLPAPSYLFGTHHLVEMKHIPNFDQIKAISLTTDAIVEEMDMTDPSMSMKLLQYAVMQDTTIKQLLSPDDYQIWLTMHLFH